MVCLQRNVSGARIERAPPDFQSDAMTSSVTQASAGLCQAVEAEWNILSELCVPDHGLARTPDPSWYMVSSSVGLCDRRCLCLGLADCQSRDIRMARLGNGGDMDDESLHSARRASRHESHPRQA